MTRLLNLLSRPGLAAALLAAAPLAGLAQTTLPAQPGPLAPLALSLPQAVRYAVQNKPSLLGSRLAEQTATAKIGELKSSLYPQINIGANVADNFKLQRALVNFPSIPTVLTQQNLADAQAGRTAELGVGEARRTPPQPFAFGLQYAGNASAGLNQALINGGLFISLKAAKVYEDLARKQTQAAEIDVVEQVSKAYYSTLVARARLTLLARNVQRLDTLLYQTQKTFKAGFAEKLDVDRLRVQRNNLAIEQQKAQRLTELSVALLKFQMGLPQQQPVALTDSLSAAVVDAAALRRRLGGANAANFANGGGSAPVPGAPAPAPGADQSGAPTPGLNTGQPAQAQAVFNYNNRVEFSTLQTQQALAGIDTRSRQAGVYPTLSLTAAYGFTGGALTARDLLAFRGPNSTTSFTSSTGVVSQVSNQNWFGFGNVGLSLNIPVFDGFRRKYQVQQARLTQQTIEQGLETLRQSIDLQDAQSRATLTNALDVLDNQQANLKLAADVARVTRIKFQAGVGSNLEVISAETDLREAQTNYYAAIYDVLVAKVDRDKATGELK